MKPGSETANDVRRTFSPRRTPFPITDCTSQIFPLHRYRGGPTGSPPPSFLNISRDYFQREARRHFLSEIAFFLILTAILAMTFVSGARVIIHFLNLPEV